MSIIVENSEMLYEHSLTTAKCSSATTKPAQLDHKIKYYIPKFSILGL
jgi:hypothetical protein